MNLNIRTAVINNFVNSTVEQIKESIDDGINSNDEIVLPGLGVLLECYYKGLNDTQKKEFAQAIKNNL